MLNFGNIQHNIFYMFLRKSFSTSLSLEVYHKNRPFQHGSGVPSLSSNSHRRAWLVDGIEFLEDQIVLAQESHNTQNG